MSKQMILELFRLIDWMIALPEALQPLFRQEHNRWEEENEMPYVTTFERLAREEGKAEGKAEGLLEGLLEAIELGLKLRFGSDGLQFLPAIRQLATIDELRRIKRAIETATTLDDIRRLIP
jgi:predicted transposase YdaD